jgi:hypothetical protein
MFDHFTSVDENVVDTNVYSKNFVALTGSIGVKEQIVGGGGVQVRGNYTTSTGHYGSTLSPLYQGLVGIEEHPDKVERNIKLVDKATKEGREYGDKVVEDYRAVLKTASRPGNDSVISRTKFGFPSTNHYRANNVRLSQPYWQQSILDATVWREPVVKYGGTGGGIETLPWPGASRQRSTGSFVEVEDTISYFDTPLQRPIDPTEHRDLYENATPPAVRSVTILGGLKTIF